MQIRLHHYYSRKCHLFSISVESAAYFEIHNREASTYDVRNIFAFLTAP